MTAIKLYTDEDITDNLPQTTKKLWQRYKLRI